MNDIEIWKDVPDFSGELQASNTGKIRTVDRFDIRGRFRIGVVLKAGSQKTGHLRIKISHKGKSKSYSVHRLVAMTFIINPFDKPYINHIDGLPFNNKICNLEWCTSKENQQHAAKIGLHDHPNGTKAKHFKCKILAISPDGTVKDVLVGNVDMVNSGYQPPLINHCLSGKQNTHRGCTFIRDWEDSADPMQPQI